MGHKERNWKAETCRQDKWRNSLRLILLPYYVQVHMSKHEIVTYSLQRYSYTQVAIIKLSRLEEIVQMAPLPSPP